MTPDAFRTLALSLPGTIESAHMNHPDFRCAGKIFASLGYPEDGWGMVKLTPEQQREYLEEAPEIFAPCAGAWGRGGATSVRLDTVPPKLVKSALQLAVENIAVKARTKRRSSPPTQFSATKLEDGRQLSSVREQTRTIAASAVFLLL